MGRNALPDAVPAVPIAVVLRLKLDVVSVNAPVGKTADELLLPLGVDKLG